MAKKTKKKTKKRKQKSTEWGIGQTLDFPKKKNPADINLLAREVVEAAIGEQLTAKSKSRKKKSK
ncbi:MAG TPA: hypothetical protein VKC60_02845 [Opitutaceae bacterium]|jgi:hypothetical protein|nr:hypothetical protein [Opitutaceae bacterium]